MESVQLTVSLIVVCSIFSLIISFLISSDISIITQRMTVNLFLLLDLLIIFLFALFSFLLYSSKWTDSLQQTILFSRIKVIALSLSIILFLIFLFSWSSLERLIIAYNVYVWEENFEFLLFVYIFIGALFFLNRNKSKKKNAQEELNLSHQQVQNKIPKNIKIESEEKKTLKREDLSSSNIQPCSFLPPSISQYGLRTVFNYPSQSYKKQSFRAHANQSPSFESTRSYNSSPQSSADDNSESVWSPIQSSYQSNMQKLTDIDDSRKKETEKRIKEEEDRKKEEREIWKKKDDEKKKKKEKEAADAAAANKTSFSWKPGSTGTQSWNPAGTNTSSSTGAATKNPFANNTAPNPFASAAQNPFKK